MSKTLSSGLCSAEPSLPRFWLLCSFVRLGRFKSHCLSACWTSPLYYLMDSVWCDNHSKGSRSHSCQKCYWSRESAHICTQSHKLIALQSWHLIKYDAATVAVCTSSHLDYGATVAQLPWHSKKYAVCKNCTVDLGTLKLKHKIALMVLPSNLIVVFPIQTCWGDFTSN